MGQKKNAKECDAKRNNMIKEEMDSKYGTGYKENEDKQMEEVSIAKRNVKGNCEGVQNPSGPAEPRKKKINLLVLK